MTARNPAVKPRHHAGGGGAASTVSLGADGSVRPASVAQTRGASTGSVREASARRGGAHAGVPEAAGAGFAAARGLAGADLCVAPPPPSPLPAPI